MKKRERDRFIKKKKKKKKKKISAGKWENDRRKYFMYQSLSKNVANPVGRTRNLLITNVGCDFEKKLSKFLV